MNGPYEAMLEGRFPVTIDVHEDGEGQFHAVFDDQRGMRVEATDDNQASAHRRCTALVMDAVRDGRLRPER